MPSCPVALVSLAFLSAALPASAYASTCGDPPPVADEVLEGEIKGKAQFLSRFLGDVALGGRIQSARTEIFSRYPDAERSRSNAYFEYQICILLMNDDTLTNTQKIDKLMEIRHVFAQPLSLLTRLEAENMLQRNRGNIERCVRGMDWLLYIDFVFEQHSEAGLNVDVFVNQHAGASWWDPAHYRISIPEEFDALGQKLSVVYADINKCIIENVKDDLGIYALAENGLFAHRIITDQGSEWIRQFKERAPEIELKTKID